MRNHSRSIPRLKGAPLLRRMIGWGLVMALLWGIFPFIFGGWVGALNIWAAEIMQPEKPSYEQLQMDDGPDLVTPFFFLMFLWSCLWTVGGAMTGFFAAYFAPAHDFKDPFLSHIFCKVGSGTYFMWLAACVTVTFSAPSVVGWIDDATRWKFEGISFWWYIVSGVIASFFGSLWIALFTALERVKNELDEEDNLQL